MHARLVANFDNAFNGSAKTAAARRITMSSASYEMSDGSK